MIRPKPKYNKAPRPRNKRKDSKQAPVFTHHQRSGRKRKQKRLKQMAVE